MAVRPMKRLGGFTLVEVMVALAVFSVVSIALVRNTTSSLRQTGMIENRITAWWLAENEMTRLRLQPRTDEDFPAAGVNREYIEMRGTSWEIETAVEATENDYVRRVVINVFKGNEQDTKATLIGFLGRY